LEAFRGGLLHARQHRIPIWEGIIRRDAATLEAVHGDLDEALTWLESSIDAFQQAGNPARVATTLAALAGLLERFDKPEIAATIYGTTTNDASTILVVDLPGVVDRLRTTLGVARFDEYVATGAAMELADAVSYARTQMRLARDELGVSSRATNR
jgi:hypothetical protein